MIKKLSKILLPLAIVIAAFIIAQSLHHFIPKRVAGVLPIEQAGIRAINYINQSALKGKGYASLADVNEARLYEIRFKIEGDKEDKAYNAYITKDAGMIYFQGAEVSKEISSSEIWQRPEPPKSDIPQAQLFVMSFCPYGNQAEQLMMPVVNLLKNKANIELHYVIYSNYQGGGPNYCLDKENKYCSMHGIQELHQDIRELCVQKYQKDKFWNFVKEINDNCNAQDVDSCWEDVAKKAVVDVRAVKTCQNNESLTLLAQEVILNQQSKVQSSPYLTINGVEYQGDRTSDAYKKGICSAFNSQPEECSKTLSSEDGSIAGGCE